MIAVDTNVLLRFLVADDPVQTPRAMRLIDEASARGEPVFVSQIVLCEIEWVLDTTYGASRAEISRITCSAKPLRQQELRRRSPSTGSSGEILDSHPYN
jgi:predicted nucleic-acid-binding protein